MFTIGCHLSASKGFLAMGKTAVSIGANTFQFFTRNPRGGTAKALDQSDIDAFLEYSREHGIGIILAHAPYTLNACSKDEKIREFAKNTMATICGAWKPFPETFITSTREAMLDRALKRGLNKYPPS